jgi:hypothetical protein
VYTPTGAINPLPLLTDRIVPKVTKKETKPKGRLINRKA